MTQLVWGQAGEKFYDTGVDRGVLYVDNKPGVAWNGLISVAEAPSGAEATPQYAGNIKYINNISAEEYGGSIEAFTYPEEFEACDGTGNIHGIAINLQGRKRFGFSYRTLRGNDTQGKSYGYKLHIVFDAQALPSEVEYSSTTEEPEATIFSWEFTTEPVTAGEYTFSKMTLDSNKVDSAILELIEGHLYGTSLTPPMLPTLDWLYSVFENPPAMYNIERPNEIGVSPLVNSKQGDFIGSADVGIYESARKSDLIPTDEPGIYTLEY